ncbi:MAG: isoprenylcysteine carboxylmethyltransferase family protein [Deltaproteobacteria bacterium]
MKQTIDHGVRYRGTGLARSNRPEICSLRIASFTLIFLTYLLGGLSLLVMLIFLFRGSFHVVNLGLSEPAGLALNAVLSLAFFIQHSVMIRPTFRQRLAQFIGPTYLGALYTITSAILLLVLVLLWQRSDHVVAALHGMLRWLLHVVVLLALGIVYWAFRSLGRYDLFGLGSIFHQLRGTHPRPQSFRVRGPYRWVRHPLYLSAVLVIWSCPDLTADRLLFNVLWTVWIVIGTRLEERDLVVSFGEAYRDYQRKVPMFIPYRIPIAG